MNSLQTIAFAVQAIFADPFDDDDDILIVGLFLIGALSIYVAHSFGWRFSTFPFWPKVGWQEHSERL
jgi:hypothetical protein